MKNIIIILPQSLVDDIQATPGSGQAFTLEYWMKIIVFEDHSIPDSSVSFFSSLLS